MLLIKKLKKEKKLKNKHLNLIQSLLHNHLLKREKNNKIKSQKLQKRNLVNILIKISVDRKFYPETPNQ